MLVIAWYLPPEVSVGVFRPLSFLKYGVDLGWRMSAISGPAIHVEPTEAGAAMLRTIPDCVAVHHITTSRLEPSWRLFPRIQEGWIEAFGMYSLAREKFKNNPPAIVVATGPPFRDFVAGYYVARYFGAKLILDYRDEWSERPVLAVDRGNLDRTWEARCLRFANAVVFTTRSQIEHQRNVFKWLEQEKCYLISNGWEPKEYDGYKKGEDCSSEENDTKTTFVISYVGYLGLRERSRHFLRLLSHVLDRRPDLQRCLRLRFVGHVGSSERSALKTFPFQEVLEFVDYVPKETAVRLMKESDALLILSEPELARYRPAKLYDYIAAGPPVLVYGYHGEVSQLVSNLKVGVFVPHGDELTLEHALDEIRGGKLIRGNHAAIDDWLKRHTRKALCQEFFGIAQNLCLASAPMGR